MTKKQLLISETSILLKKIQNEMKIHSILYKLNIDISNYEGLSNVALKILSISINPKKFTEILDNFEWWLYESVDKKIYYPDGKVVDVTSEKNLIDYIFKNYYEK